MAFFGYLLRNGVPTFSANIVVTGGVVAGYGSTAQVGLGFPDGQTGWYGSSGVLRAACAGVANSMVITSANASVAGNFLASGRFQFSDAGSTFAQVATITNGPRAANPVAWAEVNYNSGSSTGRIPIW